MITITVESTDNLITAEVVGDEQIVVAVASTDISPAINIEEFAQVQSDWNQSDNTEVDYIKNKPTIPDAQIQSDWNQTDNSKKDYIKNKPTTPEFSNITIPSLNTTAETGGEISTSLWSWIQSVYSAIVAKSVKSHIIGLWTYLKNKTVADITLTDSVTRIDITGISIKEGESFKIMIRGIGYANSYAIMTFNDISTNNYYYSVTSSIMASMLILTYPTSYYNVFDGDLVNGNIMLPAVYLRDNNGTKTTGFIMQSTFGLSISEITKISIARAGSSVFTAGTRIIVKKL